VNILRGVWHLAEGQGRGDMATSHWQWAVPFPLRTRLRLKAFPTSALFPRTRRHKGGRWGEEAGFQLTHLR